MSVFPLDIVVPKKETEERKQALADVPEDYKISPDDFNLIVEALNELYNRASFIKSGQTLYLQHPDNIVEEEPTTKDWAIRVNAAGILIIAQRSGVDGQGNATFTEGREFTPEL